MPDFTFRLNPAAADLPACSAVLNGVGRSYRVDGYRTTLSVKWVVTGSALYRTPQGRHLVTPDSFLVLNHGQLYAMEFEGRQQTETLCPFFQEGFLGRVADARRRSTAEQLDDIEARAPGMGFVERLYPLTGPLARALARIRSGVQSGDASGPWLEDRFVTLAAALLDLGGCVRREIETFPGLRPATREELYRRLHRGRDFLDSSYARPVNVAMAADAANMSPYHFHHMFQRAFRQTPNRFLQERRLDAARRLLLATDSDVTSICLDVGFQSLGSFSSLFRRRYGFSPRDFRMAAGRGGENRHLTLPARGGRGCFT